MNYETIAQVEETNPAPVPRRPKLRLRVLVVEDDQIMRRLNTELLTCSGYEVDFAMNVLSPRRNGYEPTVYSC